MDIHYNTLVVLLGAALLGANAGMVGCFTLLRRRALVGDALAHAALPGLCLAFLLVGHRSLTAMLVGALATGLAGVALMTFLRRATRTKDDAAMGTVRSVLFGLGIVLISFIQGRTAAGSKAGLDSYILGKTAGMLASDVETFAVVSLGSLACVLLLYKEFELVSFDGDFARVQGWPAASLDNLQMALAAVTTVIALPAVGAVMVAAMLILPGAALRFWTDRLGTMLAGAALLGAAIGAVGAVCSAQFSLLPAGPIIILVGTTAFLISMLVAPRRGLLARAAAAAKFRSDRRRQQLLASLYDEAERSRQVRVWLDGDAVARAHAWSASVRRRTFHDALVHGVVELRPDAAGRLFLRLTDGGRAEAVRVVRGRRLWEALLTEHPDQTGLFTSLDVAAVDQLIPRELLAPLEARLRAAGRLPELAVASTGRTAAEGPP